MTLILVVITMANNSRYSREYAIVVDEFGIDPLVDNMYSRIQSIGLYTMYEVKQHERMAIDLISINAYGTDEFWWHIMAYNGITRAAQIVEGLNLRIPNKSDLVALTSDVSATNGKPRAAKQTIII